MIARIGFGERGELPIVPAELTGIDDDATDGVAMPSYVLGGGMDDDVRSMVDRSYQPDSGGVVDNDRYAVLVCDLGYRVEIRYVQLRVAYRFQIDRPGLAGDGVLERGDIGRLDELRLPA